MSDSTARYTRVLRGWDDARRVGDTSRAVRKLRIDQVPAHARELEESIGIGDMKGWYGHSEGRWRYE